MKLLNAPLALAVLLVLEACALSLARLLDQGKDSSSWLESTKQEVDVEKQLDMVIVSYSSDDPEETLLWGSTKAHHSSGNSPAVKLISVGYGQPLFFMDPEISERGGGTGRGWMHRLRAVVEAVMEEYENNEEEDFIVLIGDAFDNYVTESTSGDTLELVKQRFLTDFSDYSIVFSAQVYCCNPWNLRDVAHAGWDEFYGSKGPENIYKHLNAGMFIGYASAIIDMAKEMNLWTSPWKQQHEFDNLLKDKDVQLNMFDVNVDDDEWQLSVWHIKEQKKDCPRSTLDVNHDLFATSDTIRSSYRDGGYLIVSQKFFYDVLGSPPPTLQKNDLEQITACPYTYDSDSKIWTNTITQGHPLIFHFAGNHWFCACQIFAADHFGGIPKKFAHSCEEEYPYWNVPVTQAVRDVSISADPQKEFFLKRDYGEGMVAAAFERSLRAGYPTAAPTGAPKAAPTAAPNSAPIGCDAPSNQCTGSSGINGTFVNRDVAFFGCVDICVSPFFVTLLTKEGWQCGSC